MQTLNPTGETHGSIREKINDNFAACPKIISAQKLGADFEVVNSTTLAPVFNPVPVEAGKVYEVLIDGACGAAKTHGGSGYQIKFCLSGTASMSQTGELLHGISGPSSSGNSPGMMLKPLEFNVSTYQTGDFSGGVFLKFAYRGLMAPSVSGDLNLEFAQGSAEAFPAKVYQHTTFQVREITTESV